MRQRDPKEPRWSQRNETKNVRAAEVPVMSMPNGSREGVPDEKGMGSHRGSSRVSLRLRPK